MKSPMKIGLTGGIGTGKSTVAKVLRLLDIPVLDADSLAKMIMHKDAVVIDALKQAFGTHIYKDQQLQRAALAKIVFNDKLQLERLNSIVHPAVRSYTDKWMSRQVAAPIVVKEAAILFESGANEGLDAVIGVAAPEWLRIKRCLSRDQTTEAQIRARMSKQMNNEEKMKRCDYVVQNDEQHAIIAQTLLILKQLKNESIY